MSEPILTVEHSDGVATVTLNRPQAMNALSRALRTEFVRTFDSLRADPDVGVIILTGSGRAFCAGLDLKELGGEGGAADDTDSAVGGADVVRALGRAPQPVIVAIGFAITGGFELALACDVLIASTEARFADTHARVGIMPGWGLSQKLSRTIGIYRAKELSLTGNYLSAAQAEAWGLVNRVVAPQELLPGAGRAGHMLSCVPDDAQLQEGDRRRLRGDVRARPGARGGDLARARAASSGDPCARQAAAARARSNQVVTATASARAASC
jgi:enoyl-CoA hydratase